MNYYEHHIKDYAAATDHLTWDEDMAYTRMLRRYYRKEQPLPADVEEVCRLVRATNDLQRAAVAAVLQEFFDLRSDGWHNEVCDEVIAKYRAGEPDREAKKTNEDTRLQRHREERRTLFAIINAAGLHRAWNTPISELRELAKKLEEGALPATPPALDSNAPATPPATATATPATATQTPDTNTQTPLSNGVEEDTHRDPLDEARGFGEAPVRVTHATAVITALRAAGIARVNSGDPRLLALLDRGAEIQHFVSAAPAALKARDPFAYVLGTVGGQLDEAAAIAAGPKARTAPPAPMRKAEAQAAVIGALTGRTNPERTSHAAGSERPIDVESRRVD